MKINLNDFIKVKLTDLGLDIYYHQYDEINAYFKKEVITPEYPKLDKDGYTKMQLWKFMQIYGKHMNLGMNNVIQPLDIIVEEER